MPELPDVVVYVEAIEARLAGRVIERVRVLSPFVVRTVEPPILALESRRVLGVRRLGKRIVIAVEGDLFLVVHLMISGRFRWERPDAKVNRRLWLATFTCETGMLVLTEASTKRRASIHVVDGAAALALHDPGGQDVLIATQDSFRAALRRENRTLKRALTDPRLFDGIGNAYSDEILHAARLSPLALTRSLDDEEAERLRVAATATLTRWTQRLRTETGADFPTKVTAFRPDMAVHGRYGKACPVCDTLVQRIVYAENEANYCPRCQTRGKLLADRSLSRLLHEDWPKTIDELESQMPAATPQMRNRPTGDR